MNEIRDHEWRVGKNLEGIAAILKVSYQPSEGTELKHEKLQSAQSITRPRFEAGTSRIQVDYHYMAPFGIILHHKMG